MTIIQLLAQYDAHIQKFGRDIERARAATLERQIIKLGIQLDIF